MAVAEAVKLLKKANTDNEKISALLLISKAVRPSQVKEDERQMIFNAVGFSFINRLLNTNDQDDDKDISSYQCLAITLLACFTTDPQLATHTEVTSKISLFLQYLSIRPLQSQSEIKAMQVDCIHILQSLTCTPRCLHLLVANDCLIILTRTLVDAERVCDDRRELKQLLIHLITQPSVITRYMDQVREVISVLANAFKHNQDRIKFDLCDILSSILSSLQDMDQVLDSDDVWRKDIATGLRDILSSKITTVMRSSALLLAGHLCQMYGIEWTLSVGDNRFLRLLANLTTVEVRMCLDGQGLDDVMKNNELICSCCIILETSVIYTASQIETRHNVLSEEDILQLHCVFTEAFKSITEFLISLQSPLPTNNILIIAIIRLLGAWLAEDNLSLTTELYQLLPKLLILCHNLFKEATEDQQNISHCLNNPIKYLLPGLSHLVTDDKPRSYVKNLLPHLLLDYMTILISSTMSSEVLSSLSLAVEVLLTMCVCEVELRRSKVYCHIARLLSRIIISGTTDSRLSIRAILIWLMITREQGRDCCCVSWDEMWDKISNLMQSTLTMSNHSASTDVSSTELWHLAMRELSAIALSEADVKQLLYNSKYTSQLVDLVETKQVGNEESIAVKRLQNILQST